MSKVDEVEKCIYQRKSEMIKVEGTKKVEETKNHFGRIIRKDTAIEKGNK